MLWDLITLHLLSLSPSLPLLIISSLSPSLIIFKSYHRHHPPHHHHRSSSYSLTTPFLVSTEERTVSLLVCRGRKADRSADCQAHISGDDKHTRWEERQKRWWRVKERQRRGDDVEVLMQMMMFSNGTYLSFTAKCVHHPFLFFLEAEKFLSRWEVYYQNKMNAVVCYVIVHCKTKLLWLMNG